MQKIAQNKNKMTYQNKTIEDPYWNDDGHEQRSRNRYYNNNGN